MSNMDVFEFVEKLEEPKSYHVLVAYNVKRLYVYPFAVHLFLPEKPLAVDAFRKAEELLDEHFPEWRKDVKIVSKILGVEEIPVEVDEEYYTVVSFDVYGLDIARSYRGIPFELARKIEEYRLSRLTIDVDPYKPYYGKKTIAEKLRQLARDYVNVEFYKTHEGYHARVILPRKLDFKELEELRSKYGDDPDRLRLDNVYYSHNMTYLTNILFNEKYWYENNTLRHYYEQPITLQQILAELGYVEEEKKEEKEEKEESVNVVTAVGEDKLIAEIEKLTHELTRELDRVEGSLKVVVVYNGVARIGRLVTARMPLEELYERHKLVNKLTATAFKATYKKTLLTQGFKDKVLAVFFMPNLVYLITKNNRIVWLSLDIYYDAGKKSFYRLDEETHKLLEQQIAEMMTNNKQVGDKAVLLDYMENRYDRIPRLVDYNELYEELSKKYKIIQ